MRLLLACACVAGVAVTASAQSPSTSGILLLAHGGAPTWNDHVLALARAVDARMPVEVAFGMASRASIESALHRLHARGVTAVTAVPLFVSSHSSVVRSTEFLLGVRSEAPPDLALFARMDHGAHGGGDHASHCAAPCDGTQPIPLPAPVRLTEALDRHPTVGRILVDRASSISTDPASEAVILVAHGPVPDDDNQRWLADMAVLAAQVQASRPYAAVRYLTVRDDAGPALRDQATRELRERVAREREAGRRVLVVPHLLSFGGIERGILKRLEGLEYTIASQALIPDDRLVGWVLEQAGVKTP
jgi:sirohydrochlorin ferrochelatase